MPAFKKFGPGDQVDNVLVLEPRYDLASGNLGWRGSPEGSASLSLYGGVRRSPAHVVTDVTYQSLYPGTGQPAPRLGLPTTASINFVWMTDEGLDLTTRCSTRWGEEHWDTVMRLYQDYAHLDPDYVTSSYDHYCLYFQRDSANGLSFPPLVNQGVWLTSSFSVEAWVKPFSTSSLTHDFTVASMNGLFWFGITGSQGVLALTSSFGSHTASVGPAIRRWSHVAFSYDAVSQTGSFAINGIDVGHFTQATFSGSVGPNVYDPIFSVGNQIVGPGLDAGNVEDMGSLGDLTRAFHGFIGETRLWSVPRSYSDISGSMSGPILFGAYPTGSIVRTRLNEGPIATFPDQTTYSTAMGSGTVNLAALEAISLDPTSKRYPWGNLMGFDGRQAPVWHPNDNVRYYPPKALAGPPAIVQNVATSQAISLDGAGIAAVSRMLVIDVPSAFYGREIVRGSVSITDNTYTSGSFGLVRTLVDDGRGGLYLSGSACSSSLADREDYAGVGWNKVGNVFYSEGLIVIKDPALLDFGCISGQSDTSVNGADLLQLSFRGQTRTPVKTLMCRVDRGDFNATENATFWSEDDDGNRVRRHQTGSLYATTVGIYNAQYELVAVARLADPLRIRDRDRINIKLRMDF